MRGAQLLDYIQRSTTMYDRQAERGGMSGRPPARTIRLNMHGSRYRTATDEGIVSKKETQQEDTPPTAPLKPDISLPVSFSNQIVHRSIGYMGHPATIPTVRNISDSVFMEYMSSR